MKGEGEKGGMPVTGVTERAGLLKGGGGHLSCNMVAPCQKECYKMDLLRGKVPTDLTFSGA